MYLVIGVLFNIQLFLAYIYLVCIDWDDEQ
jgi:hypothetical protein